MKPKTAKKLTGGAISEFDDPDGLLEGNPETKRYPQPDGLTFEVQGPGDKWLPCWLMQERRIKREKGVFGLEKIPCRFVKAVTYRLVEALFNFVGELGVGARIRILTTLEQVPDDDGELWPDDGGWKGIFFKWGYKLVTVVQSNANR
jgi:hypothetical protein